MPDAPSFRPPPSRAEIVRFCAVLALFLGLALTRFTTPSMWHDELILALSCGLDWGALVARYLVADFHPPYHALLMKGFASIQNEDWFLRLPSVAATAACLWLAWRLGREWGGRVGLAFSCFLAVNFWAVLLSRQARPYALSLCLAVYCFLCCARTIAANRPLPKLFFAALTGLIAIHFGNSLAVGAMLAALALWHLRTRSPVSRRSLLTSLAASAAGALMVYPFYVNASSVWLQNRSLAERLDRLGHNLLSLLTGLEHNSLALPTQWTGLVLPGLIVAGILWLACAGTRILARGQRGVLALALFSVALPILYVTVPPRQYGEFQPWHLFLILPGVFFLASLGAARSRHGMAVAAIALTACAGQFTALGHIVYSESGSKGIYKHLARQMCTDRDDTFYALTNDLSWLFTSWYLDRQCPANPLAHTVLGPQQQTARLVFFTGAGPLGDPPSAVESQAAQLWFGGTPANETQLPTQGAYGHGNRFHVGRYEAQVVRDPLIFLTHARMETYGENPLDVLARAYSMEGMGLKLALEPCQDGRPCFYGFPTSGNRPGELVYRFALPEGSAQEAVTLTARYFLHTMGSIELRASDPQGRVLGVAQSGDWGLGEKTLELSFPPGAAREFFARVTLRSGQEPSPMVYTHTNAGLFSLSAALR